jgi:hypothetical protein
LRVRSSADARFPALLLFFRWSLLPPVLSGRLLVLTLVRLSLAAGVSLYAGRGLDAERLASRAEQERDEGEWSDSEEGEPMESKPRFRPNKAETDHFRLHLTNQATGAETFACFASQGLAGAWLQQQMGVTAVMSVVDGPDCFYCRAKEG